MSRAVALAGLQRDPLRHALEAVSVALDGFEAAAAEVRIAADTAADAIRRPVSPEAEEALVRRLETAAASGADQHAAALVQQHSTGNLLLGAACVAILTMAACLGGYWYGRDQVRGEARAYVASQTAKLDMVQAGPTLPLADAAAWGTVIRNNPNVRDALAQATGHGRDSTGRGYAFVPLWLDAPPAAAPKKP
ncbi:hypothetical protein [Roseicella aquatilis]|uniref:hypothetical protein n=1 Tax=Roseicella aquatilis TaxID=2527868 RepID=UPI00140482D5|nr:hypothetical protein [Roseicella aquatilis]